MVTYRRENASPHLWVISSCSAFNASSRAWHTSPTRKLKATWSTSSRCSRVSAITMRSATRRPSWPSPGPSGRPNWGKVSARRVSSPVDDAGGVTASWSTWGGTTKSPSDAGAPSTFPGTGGSASSPVRLDWEDLPRPVPGSVTGTGGSPTPLDGRELVSVGSFSSDMMAQSTSPAVMSLIFPFWATRDISFLKPEKPTLFSSNPG